jgi:integrase
LVFLRLEATTGAPPGEVVALHWCDVDLDALAVAINGNVVHTCGLPSGYVRKLPKTDHGERVLAIDAQTAKTAALLRSHPGAVHGAGRSLWLHAGKDLSAEGRMLLRLAWELSGP